MSSTRPLRAVSIGHHFYDPRVMNVGFGAAQTMLDRDVVLLNLGGFYRDYNPDPFNARYQGAWCVGDDHSPRILRDMDRRRSELRQALDVGKTLVVFVPPPERFFAGTGDDEWTGTGRNRHRIRSVNEHSVLEVLPFKFDTEQGASSELELRTGDPFAAFWRANRDRMAAAAVIKSNVGSPALVIRGTDAVVAGIGGLGKGVILFLPQELGWGSTEEDGDDVDEDERAEDGQFLDTLFDLIRAVRRDRGDFALPAWADRYRIPGEQAETDRLEVAEDAAARALAEVDERKRALAVLRQRKVLFTGTGPALEALVADALRGLGFDVEDGAHGRTDRIARLGDRVAVVEVKGLSKSAGEKDSAQLEKWVSEYHIEHGIKPKGLLVANGWRDKPLADRSEDVFPHQMLGFATAREHALVEGGQLLAAWLDADAHPDDKHVIAESLLSCVGRWDRYEGFEAEWAGGDSASAQAKSPSLRTSATETPETA